MTNSIKVISIESVGVDGMYEATISLPDHQRCIRIIGSDLTVCIERTTVVIKAFKEEYA